MVMTFVGWKRSDKRDYRDAQRERAEIYSKVDQVLYEMCRRWLNHKNLGIVQAKVRIIGRVYAAGLERKGKRDKSKGVYETVAEILHRNQAWIDSGIDELNRLKRLSEPSYERILCLHGDIVKLLRKETRSKLNFRSFVSKYLHFHIPIVPLFDSVASYTINRPDWYPWKKFKEHTSIPMSEKYDPVYCKFFNLFLLYFRDLKELKLHPSVRSADWFLIWSAYKYYDR
ncbi:MAG: hypothetical protein ABSH06_07825 [Thermodesulfobacteriota bacterium]